MKAVKGFAQVFTAPKPIFAQVRGYLANAAGPGVTVQTSVLDRVTNLAMHALWGNRPKSSVPDLVLSQAKEPLREQGLLITAERPEIRHAEGTPTEGRPRVERHRRDVLSIDGDVLQLDDRDMLMIDDWGVLKL